MKIVQVNTVCGTGSVGRIVVDLYKTSQARDYKCYVAYGRGSAPADIEGYLIGNKKDFYFHVLRNFFRGESGFGSKNVTKRFLAWLDEVKPDVIHLHNIHGFYLQVEDLFAYLKKREVKVIWTLHDCWPFTGHCAYFDYAQCDKWKDGCHHCKQHRKAYPYAIFKDNSKKAYLNKKSAFLGVKDLTIVTPSEWLKEIVKQSFLGEYPVVVIPNGIDLKQFCPTEYTGDLISKEKKIVLGVANIWETRKGLSYFEKLVNTLPKEYQIVLVGVSKAQKKQLSSKYPQDRMVLIERTSNVSELAAIYTRADVYVNFTLEDNFPTTNLEALACGTPVVTFDTGGSKESLDESCGVVVPKHDFDTAVAGIKEVCEGTPKKRECLARAAMYAKEVRFAEYMDLYF